MHLSTKAAAAAFGGTLLAGAASPAFAGSHADAAGTAAAPRGRVSVQPTSATPGKTVTVFDGNTCATATGTASSMAFAAPAALRAVRGGQLAGRTTVRSGALGTYPVIVRCGKKEYAGTIKVVKRAAAKPGHRRRAVSPKGAAATGDGTTSQGSGAALAETGLAVTGLGAVIGLVVLRRRWSSRS